MRTARFIVAGITLLAGTSALANAPASNGLPLPSDGMGLLATDRALIEDPLGLLLRLDLGWANSPLRLPAQGGALSTVVDNEVALRASLALGITRWLEAGVSVPVSVAFYSKDGQSWQSGAGAATGYDAASGDLRAFLKLAPPTISSTRFAFIVGLSTPSGDAASYRSDNVWGVEPRVVFDLKLGHLSLIANAGARLHPAILASNDMGCAFAIGSELTYSAAAAMTTGHFSIAAEVAGSEQIVSAGCPGVTADGAFAARQRTRAGLVSIAYDPSPGVRVFLGGGLPIVDGDAARTGVRAMAGFAWRPLSDLDARAAHHIKSGQSQLGNGDRDGDGIPDDKDLCPDEPEDKDGFQDDDGCPDPDNDADGVPDSRDKCPNVPEDKDGFEDSDGCPDPDNDKDGIPDELDKCPDQAMKDDGYSTGDGCADDDIDKDGVPNTQDACPYTAGPASNHGCPLRPPREPR